jgi:hypothetical protein
VQLVEPGAQQVVGQGRVVDDPASQVRVDDVRVEVEHPLAEPPQGARAARVRDVRRQQQDRPAGGTVLVPVQVVAHHPIVDDHQRPRVVGVRRVPVVGESGVEGLGDAGHAGHPRAHLAHVTNVQETSAQLRHA